MPTGGGGKGGGPTLTLFQPEVYPDNNAGVAANAVYITSFVLPFNVTFSKITVIVGVLDATVENDIGIYDTTGALIANIGASAMSATGIHTFNTLQGSKTINAGIYLFALTSVATTVQINISNATLVWNRTVNVATSSGGVLPSSIGAVAANPGQGRFIFFLS